MSTPLSTEAELMVLALMLLLAAAPLLMPWRRLAWLILGVVAFEVVCAGALWESAMAPRAKDDNDGWPLGLSVVLVGVTSVLAASVLARIIARKALSWWNHQPHRTVGVPTRCEESRALHDSDSL